MTSCNGILDGIYDKPTDTVEAGLPYGYKSLDDDSLGGTLFFNSTSYTRWTYFNLRHITSDTIGFETSITPEALKSLERERFAAHGWDIALHRSVPKTGNGTVAMTRFASVGELATACRLSGGVQRLIADEQLQFVPDEWGDEQVALDISDMFNGNVVYLHSPYNSVLNSWLDIDISLPPPVYTMSRRAYILRLASGEHYALCLTNFRNAQNLTAWLTIDFRFLP